MARGRQKSGYHPQGSRKDHRGSKSRSKSQKRILAVVDTNVLYSAFGYGGPPAKVLALGRWKGFSFLASEGILAEYVDVMHRLTIEMGNRTVLTLYEEFLESVVFVPQSEARVLSRDPKDDIFLPCALGCQADYLITGDRDLLVLNQVGQTKIVTPRQFLKKMGVAFSDA